MGTRKYAPGPDGTHWASGVLWWRVVMGEALFYVHPRRITAYNGHKHVDVVVVDVRRKGQELDSVAVPSPALSRDLEMWAGRWIAVRILRDGKRRPWRAMPVTDGPWAATADELNADL
ncbi:hypothetical protein ACFTWH_08465 [Streptomyces sp. NPDC057011]|uniref:hypothetical protein n=1 Tax=unclassified Streptomyces TaxID=2593676 RepID=UPI003644A1E1